jgi:hypothetical protein
MATLDDINILDRQPDPHVVTLWQAGRQPTVERVKANL